MPASKRPKSESRVKFLSNMATILESPTRSWLSDAAVIAGVPAFISILSYSYEFGYASWFAIPWQLVSVTWTTAFEVCKFLAFLVFIWFLVAQPILLVMKDRRVAVTALFWVSYILFFTAMLILDHKQRLMWSTFVALSFLGALIHFLWPILFYRTKGTNYSEWLRAFQVAESRGGRPYEDFRNWIAASPLFFVGTLLFFGISLSGAYGTYVASHKADFYVVPSSPESVLLTIYGDTVVAARFERKTNTFQRDFIIMKVSGSSPLNLRMETVGPLRPSEK
jgi:hypothetical protein